MDVAAPDAQGVDVGQAGGVQIVAFAHTARRRPGDVLAQQGAGRLHRFEQGGLGRVHRLGRAGEAAVQVQRQPLERRFGGDPAHRRVDPVGGGLVRHAHIEAHHGLVGHHVQGAAARNLGDVDGDARVATVQPVQGGGEDGRAGHRIAPLVESPPGVGRATRHDQMIVAAALARARQRPVRQRRLIGQAHMTARAQFGQQRRGGRRADLLVGAQQHGPADAVPIGVGLERLQRGQHHADPALHVRHARPVQGAVRPCRHGLEPAVGGEDRVVMAGQHDLDRRTGSRGDLQGGGMGLGPHRSVVGDAGRAVGRDTLDRGGQGLRRRFQRIQHGVQTDCVAAAGVDVRPVDGAPDDGLASPGDVVEDGLVGG